MRVWTPDQIVVDKFGYRDVQLAPKRLCNECGNPLGDLNDRELVDSIHGRRKLLPVHDECGLCLGFHVLFAKPETREPGHTGPDTWNLHVLCPALPDETGVLACAAWLPCMCVPPEGAEPLSIEWEAFTKQPCPHSPTGEHRWLSEAGYVGAPTGTCWYQLADKTADAADEIVTAPGMYPVEVGAFDDTTPQFYPADLEAAIARKVATPA